MNFAYEEILKDKTNLINLDLVNLLKYKGGTFSIDSIVFNARCAEYWCSYLIESNQVGFIRYNLQFEEADLKINDLYFLKSEK